MQPRNRISPSYRYADQIYKFTLTNDPMDLETLKSIRYLHPKKFFASLRWGFSQSTVKRIEKLTSSKNVNAHVSTHR